VASDKPFPLRLDVRGELDTAMPVGDRAPGTLVAAADVRHDALGPRRGSLAFTRVWEGPGVASLYDAITVDGSGASYCQGRGQSYEDAFRDLGTKFTMDLWFRYDSTTGATNLNILWKHQNGNGEVEVSVRGPAHADHEKIVVLITTTPTRTTFDPLVSFTCSTRLSVGTAQTDKCHIRLVRDGANAYLYLNGVLDGSTTSLVATSPIFAQQTTASGTWILGDLGLRGRFFGCVLRDGAFRTEPIEAVMPCGPWNRNVHYYILGRRHALGATEHYFDAGRFSAHGRLVGTGYGVTAANDDAAPAPASVQGLATWTTRTNRTATSVMCGGLLSTKGVT
jgi:hypothetical protein